LGLPERACPSGHGGLLLGCQHLGSLLIHLLQRLGLCGLRCRSLLLQGGLSLSHRCGLLLRCLLPLQGSLHLNGLDCRLLLLELLPGLGSDLCFVLAPPQLMLLRYRVTVLALVPVIPVAIPISAASPIAATADQSIGPVVARP